MDRVDTQAGGDQQDLLHEHDNSLSSNGTNQEAASLLPDVTFSTKVSSNSVLEEKWSCVLEILLASCVSPYFDSSHSRTDGTALSSLDDCCLLMAIWIA